MNPSVKWKIKKIIPFGPIWAIYGLIYSLLEKGLLGDSALYPATGNPYNFSQALTITPVASLIVGWIFGTAEVLFFSNLFNHKAFILKILYKIITYCAAIVLFLITLTFLTNSARMNMPFFKTEVVGTVIVFFESFAFWSVIIYAGSIMGLTLFIYEISDNLGLNVVKNFFTGRYHRPKEENRIFMFLDMKSSTTIAEKLGHVTYFKLLNQYYKDISHSIIQTSGEIYQYVGDEIIVSWTIKNGLKNNNCIQCFFLIKRTVHRLSKAYIDRFGIVPGFKAGMHFGRVTTGEIGQIKKEIVFTGDVLNTTSRIQGLCNTYKVDLLVSDVLIDQLTLSNEYVIRKMGKSVLRGKNRSVNLFALELTDS